MPLKPVLNPDNPRLLDLRTARDFIGVQTNHSDPHRGINRQAQWTRDLTDWADREHTLYGVHDTPRIPRAVVFAGYNYGGNGNTIPVGQRYDFSERSYLMGKYLSQQPGLFSVSVVGDGVIDITLAIPMPSADYGVIDLCQAEHASTVGGTWQAVWLYGVPISASVVRITRRCNDPSPSDVSHGPIAFALVG